MALRQILKDEHPVLRQAAWEVKNLNSAVRRLIDDMVETMHDSKGVGLAANQVGVGKRILVACVGEETVLELINPHLIKSEGEELGFEGCLSVPGQYGEIPRCTSITISALDRNGKPVLFRLHGLAARIVQHELDHLDGILITDRAVRMVDPEEFNAEETETKDTGKSDGSSKRAGGKKGN